MESIPTNQLREIAGGVTRLCLRKKSTRWLMAAKLRSERPLGVLLLSSLMVASMTYFLAAATWNHYGHAALSFVVFLFLALSALNFEVGWARN